MFSSDILYSKIVDHKGELDGAEDVLPQAGGVRNFEISMGFQFLFEVSVREGSRLG